MTFFDRYSQICEAQGLEPCSQKAAEMFHVTRATISSWGKNNTTPKGETVALIADALGVSTDYLLGRTDDPADPTKPKLDIAFTVDTSGSMMNPPQQEEPEILKLYNQLDIADQLKVEGIIQGLLLNDKYKKGQQNFA